MGIVAEHWGPAWVLIWAVVFVMSARSAPARAMVRRPRWQAAVGFAVLGYGLSLASHLLIMLVFWPHGVELVSKPDNIAWALFISLIHPGWAIGAVVGTFWCRGGRV